MARLLEPTVGELEPGPLLKLKTARDLGLTVPAELLKRADRVIE